MVAIPRSLTGIVIASRGVCAQRIDSIGALPFVWSGKSRGFSILWKLRGATP
jgi:hypothetical protein